MFHSCFYKKNLSFVINILLNNGYPIDLIFKHINLRLRKLVSNSLLPKDTNASNSSETDARKNIIVLSYLNFVSEIIASTIDRFNNLLGYRILNKLNSVHSLGSIKTRIHFLSTIIRFIRFNVVTAMLPA